MNSQALIIPGIIIIVAIITLVSLPSDEIEDLGPITIVANLPITGSGSGIGIEDRDGLKLAVDELNAFGGINGKNIELVIVDNETNLEKAKKIFLETEQTYKPLLHISALSFISTDVGQLAEESEVVLIALSAVAPEVTQDRDWVFRYFPMAKDEAVPILQTLEKLNVNDLGILYLNDIFGKSITSEVKTQFENLDKIVSTESFNEYETFFHDKITKLQNKDAIYIVGFPDHIILILQQLREVNYQGEILTSSDGATFNIFAMPESQGVYLAAPAIYDSNFQLASKISYDYKQKYGKSFDYNSANSYDVIRILNGLLDEEEVSRVNLKDILSSGYDYSGLFGHVTVEPKNHDMTFQLFPAKISKGVLEFEN
jgi:branched-chain amino acid transport system substrate-binding protein